MRVAFFEGTADDAAIPHAALWIEQLVTGSLASILATIAVALLGFAMLTGRVDFKAAIRVIVGCFIVFNAAAISRGIAQFAARDAAPPEAPAMIALPALPSGSPVFDPYAGATTPH